MTLGCALLSIIANLQFLKCSIYRYTYICSPKAQVYFITILLAKFKRRRRSKRDSFCSCINPLHLYNLQLQCTLQLQSNYQLKKMLESRNEKLFSSTLTSFSACDQNTRLNTKLNKKTARRAENPAHPQILLGAYRTPTRHIVYDLSVSFKAIDDSGVESPYIILNHKKISYLFSLGQNFRPYTNPCPGYFFFQNMIISSLGQKEGSCEKKKINNRRLHNLDMLLQFI